METPWGHADTVEHFAPGIASVSTPSHGGIHLDKEPNEKVPPYMRRADGWYEEDVDWSIVATIFPQYFDAKARTHAKEIFKSWRPLMYEMFYGEKIPTGKSYVKDGMTFQYRHKNDYIVMAAWGSWHPKVPEGFVGVFAGVGGRRADGQYPEDTAYFLVPEEEYDERSPFGFVVDLERHKQIQPIDTAEGLR